MIYQEQLNNALWQEKRRSILERDNYQCTKCHMKRSKYLRLNSQFGVKTYNEIKQLGFLPVLVNGNSVMTVNNIVLPLRYLGDKTVNRLDELFYAQQFTEPANVFDRPRPSYVCFEEDLRNMNLADLNIHHKYYINGKLAWEYDDDALETLCVDCHQEEHAKNQIPVYEDADKITVLYRPGNCDRCAGSGYLSEYNYHYNGICFTCSGHGVLLE